MHNERTVKSGLRFTTADHDSIQPEISGKIIIFPSLVILDIFIFAFSSSCSHPPNTYSQFVLLYSTSTNCTRIGLELNLNSSFEKKLLNPNSSLKK